MKEQEEQCQVVCPIGPPGRNGSRVSKYCHIASPYPAITKHLYNIYAMLVQRQRRWADVV